MKLTTILATIALSAAPLAFAQDNYVLTTPLDLSTTGGTVRAILPDGAGNLYMSIDNQVRKYAPDGSFLIVAGTTSQGYNGDGQAANAAQLSMPMGLALDAAGDLYIADKGNDRVRMVNPAGIISTVAGGGNGPAGGQANGAQLIQPSSVAVDASGNLYITAGIQVFKVSGGVITVVVNKTTAPDSPATEAPPPRPGRRKPPTSRSMPPVPCISSTPATIASARSRPRESSAPSLARTREATTVTISPPSTPG